MEANWLDILTRYILPPFLGGASGLIAIYANWGVEKRKQRLQRRRELVSGWRLELLPLVKNRDVIWKGPHKENVLSSPYYASLRPHLQAGIIEQLEHDHVRIVVSFDKSKPESSWAHHFPLNVLVEEIARLEKKWKLV